MSGELEYDEDGVNTQMTRLLELAGTVSEARTALNTAVTGQNGAWSTEPAGSLFTQQLLSVADSVLTGFDELRTALENTAVDLYTSAGNVVNAEADAIAEITALQAQLDQGNGTPADPTTTVPSDYEAQTPEAQQHATEVEQEVEQSEEEADAALEQSAQGEGDAS